MSDSSSQFDALATSSANLPTRINEQFDSVSPASLGGRRASACTNLTWGFYGGDILVNGVPTTVVNNTVLLTASTTNYVSISQAGVVSTATTVTVANIPLYTVVTGATTVSSYTDTRNSKALDRLNYGIATVTITDTATAATLTQPQALCDTITTSVVAFTAQRNLVVPLVRRRWTVRNNATGFGLQVIGASGTGIVIGVGKVADVECDGINVLRVTADA